VNIHLLNFATSSFKPYQDISNLTARRFGITQIHSFGPGDIDIQFAEENKEILSATRGAGFWLWKPYFISRVLECLGDGDLLIYADAGMHFVNSPERMVASIDKSEHDLLILGEAFLEAHYTKRDTFVLMDTDHEEFAQSKQRLASCFLVRKSSWSQCFFNRYLRFSCDPRILTDIANTCGLDNYPDFIAHRHDQSIFSLLSKLDNVTVPLNQFIADGHQFADQQILNHTRMHKSPRDIAKALLIDGTLSLKDLEKISSVH